MKYMCGSCFMPRKFRVGREIINLIKKIVIEIEKVPIFSPKTILLFRVYRVKKIRVGRQQEPHIYFI